MTMTTTMRVSDYIMNRLANVGVRHVFQVTGRGTLFLSDALAKHQSLSSVSLHHEQSCAFAAISYAEKSRGLGACLVSTGCASTNTLTGVLSAWQDGVPCIFISGQNLLRETSRYSGVPLRTFGQQEADIISLVAPITKYAHMLTSADEIFHVMDVAIAMALSGRKGPVWVDVPLDLQSALIKIDDCRFQGNCDVEKSLCISDAQIADLISDISKAERPIIIFGSGVRASGSEEKLKFFLEQWNFPAVYSASAPDVYSSVNPLSIGSIGSMGCSRAANFAVANSDLVLVLGSRLTSLVTGPDFCKFARAAKLIVVDIDSVEHSKNSVRIDNFIQSDLSLFFDKINQIKACEKKTFWVEKCLHWKNIFGGIEQDFLSEDDIDLYQLADRLSHQLPLDTTMITDSGLAEVILPTNIRFPNGVRCIHPASQGVMGFALPAAIGAQFAHEGMVLAVIGDGSIMMNLQELESIRCHNLPVKIIVINNNLYSIIRRRQNDLFRGRTIGTDSSNGLSCPDFSKVADCFGLKYMRIERVEHLEVGLMALFEERGAVLCEMIGRHDQSYIELGHVRSVISRKHLRRPLEDQKPFMARDVFLREMLVEPIDQ